MVSVMGEVKGVWSVSEREELSERDDSKFRMTSTSESAISSSSHNRYSALRYNRTTST
jgi:hypothetical protein